MADAGVELVVDMTPFGVVGLIDVFKRILPIRRAFHHLLDLAIERKPEVIIGVDYGGFNLRFAAAIRQHLRSHRRMFHNWNPKIVQFVSPQVWASRAGRAKKMEQNHDLLLSIFPFEKDWYAAHAPALPVEFVGNPIFDRYASAMPDSPETAAPDERPLLLLLPGSRPSELGRHLPCMLVALEQIRARHPQLRAALVLPNETLATHARPLTSGLNVEVRVGGLEGALREAAVAIASTGTVTVECAFFGVPAVTMYKTSSVNYEICRRLVKVNSLTMPNLLAGESVYPEFIQNDATPENLSRAALELLEDPRRRAAVRARLAQIVGSLGSPGAFTRAADAIVRLVPG
jgi:lipid-A-disaccharide synthase